MSSKNALTLTILGSGTSTGVPLICCNCTVCRSRNPKNKRLRASAWVMWDGVSILVDTATDLRQQALKAKIPRLDAVLFTHPHADHICGIDEVRGFNFAQKGRIPVYGNAWTCEYLTTRFDYIFKPGPVEGGGIPLLDLIKTDSKASAIDVFGKKVIPIAVSHGSRATLGYRFGNVACVTDCS